MDFDMSETATKNIFICGEFDQQRWNKKTKNTTTDTLIKYLITEKVRYK